MNCEKSVVIAVRQSLQEQKRECWNQHATASSALVSGRIASSQKRSWDLLVDPHNGSNRDESEIWFHGLDVLSGSSRWGFRCSLQKSIDFNHAGRIDAIGKFGVFFPCLSILPERSLSADPQSADQITKTMRSLNSTAAVGECADILFCKHKWTRVSGGFCHEI